MHLDTLASLRHTFGLFERSIPLKTFGNRPKTVPNHCKQPGESSGESSAAHPSFPFRKSNSWIMYRVFGGNVEMGPTFWARRMTKHLFLSMIGHSDHSESSANRSGLKNWVYIAGAWRLMKKFRRSFPLLKKI